MKLALVTLLVIGACAGQVYSKERNNKPYRVVCYYESWNTRFTAEDINPNVCTHVNYAFAVLGNNSIQLFNKNVDDGEVNDASKGQGMIRRMNELRKANPHLTTMISLGGWAEGSTKYSEMVQSVANRKVFVESVVKFLKEFDLDGIDLDWEYPGFFGVGGGDRRPGRAEDKEDFVSLLKELKEAFKPYGYILSAAVAAGKSNCERAYDIPGLNKYLDFINLMTYDYHGSWDRVTGHNAPLYYSPNATGIDKEFTAQFTVEYWISKGMDPSKIVFGIPLYGHSYKLAGSDTKVGAAVSGGGREGGSYNHICSLVKQSGWQLLWDDVAQVPYALHNGNWLSYENLKSIHKKLDYVIAKKLGGSMVWAVDGDDSKGHCGDGKFPMMKAQMKALNKVDSADVHIPVPAAHKRHN